VFVVVAVFVVVSVVMLVVVGRSRICRLTAVPVVGSIGGISGIIEKHVDRRRVDPVFRRIAHLVANGESLGHGREDGGIGAGGDQGGTDHVAGGTGSTVENERSHAVSEATAEQIPPGSPPSMEMPF